MTLGGAGYLRYHYFVGRAGILAPSQRVRKGHAPANPVNPRHARLLQSSKMTTTIDWLDRNPIGRQLSTDELQRIQV